MLQELKVSQFAIIDNLDIEFQNGLNILSGETGSGKSVLLKSLALLMGEKATPDIIKNGSTQATVEGSFNLKQRPDILNKLKNSDIPLEEDILIVKRVITQADKSKVYLNGSLSTLSQLREIVAPMIEVTGNSAPLIEMTGQHENRNLLSKSYHLDLLDQYCEQFDKRLNYEKKYTQLLELKTEISDLEKNSQIKNQQLDFLKFQLNEFNQLNLNVEKDLSLEDDIKKIKSAEKVYRFIEDCESLLFDDQDSVLARLKTVYKKSTEISSVSPKVNEQIDQIQQAQNLIEDSFFNLRKELKNADYSPEVLEEKEARLSQIRKIQKKYGSDLAKVATEFVNIEKQISELENSDEIILKLKKQVSLVELELKKISEELHAKRSTVATKLEKIVNNELLDLNMKGVVFSIQVSKLENLTSSGISDVEYLCQTSAKDPKKPIAKVASGGELSRILLALKKALGNSDTPRTYLFDEVDTGVSGNTAEKVGKKLKSIAQGQQVICVTHLPQVAAYGDVHFSINKSSSNKGVSIEVNELKIKSRIEEIARLISGEKITKTSLAHAEQLLSEGRG